MKRCRKGRGPHEYDPALSRQCPECTHEWKVENKERLKLDSKRYYAENAETYKARARRWNTENPEQHEENKKRWLEEVKSGTRVPKVHEGPKTCRRGHEHKEDRCPRCYKKWYREWFCKNAERIREESRESYIENAETYKTRSNRWRANNPDYTLAYRLSHPERWQEASEKRKLAKQERGESFSPEQLLQVLEFYDGLCAYCEERPYEDWDHIVPLSRGGWHAVWNLVPACKSCNGRKHAKTWEPKRRHPLMKQGEASLPHPVGTNEND